MNLRDYKVTLLIFSGIVIITFLFIFSFTIDQEIAIAPTTTGNNNSIATNETLNQPVATNMTVEEITLAASRDQQRIEDINILKLALDDYLSDNGYYPDTIDEIVPDYIPELPNDPEPASYEYNYTCIGSTDPCVFYDLSYSLEIGTDELPAGINFISPDEIASP